MLRNVVAFPDFDVNKIFPDEPNPCAFMCKKFYVAGTTCVLVPSAEMTIDASPEPMPALSNTLKIPVIKINVMKYVSLLRGLRACAKNGFMECDLDKFAVFLVLLDRRCKCGLS